MSTPNNTSKMREECTAGRIINNKKKKNYQLGDIKYHS